MRREVELEVFRRLINLSENPMTEIPTRSTQLSVDCYFNVDEFEKERVALFERQPVIVAHISEIPNGGDFVTETVGDVPLIVMRDREGNIGVFMNSCSHRGARLLDGEKGNCRKSITCRYHAWSYSLDGSLSRVPNENVFAELNHVELGLRKLRHEIRHGFVWVVIDPQTDKELNIATGLGPIIDDDFMAFELGTHTVASKRSETIVANWKLVVDAFAEGYHVKSLHGQSLWRFFLEGQILDDCSPHVRQVGARKTLLESAKGPEEAWDVRKDTTPFYSVFPNAVFVFHPTWMSQLSIMPESVDRVRLVHRMLISKEPEDAESRARFEKSFAHIHDEVFVKEDFSIAQSIQSTLKSGANDKVVIGGLEERMRLFHAVRDRALEAF